ncbi:hypothetical protein ACOAOT_25020 [Lacrimispora sp. AGF001]|uniref:hypothetical protein n=1 Tax=Lacrimispora sp. AGF001 TaxID=3401631 RepID=UPI003B437E4C
MYEIFSNIDKILSTSSIVIIVISMISLLVAIFAYIQTKNNKNIEESLFYMILKLYREKKNTKSNITKQLETEGFNKQEQKELAKIQMEIIDSIPEELISIINSIVENKDVKLDSNILNKLEEYKILKDKIEKNKKKE